MHYIVKIGTGMIEMISYTTTQNIKYFKINKSLVSCIWLLKTNANDLFFCRCIFRFSTKNSSLCTQYKKNNIKQQYTNKTTVSWWVPARYCRCAGTQSLRNKWNSTELFWPVLMSYQHIEIFYEINLHYLKTLFTLF